MGWMQGHLVRAWLGVIPMVIAIGVLAMPREEYIADPMVMRCETVSLLNLGTLEVPAPVAAGFRGDKGQYFYETRQGKFFSKYGVMNGLMNLPPLWVEKLCEGTLPYHSPARVIYLNFYNLLLSVATAFYLVAIAARYTRSAWVVILFVLTAFYCTYWWNYLRAQNSEIYQTLFLLAFFYHLTASPRQPVFSGEARLRSGPLFAAGAFLGVLILVKTVYVVLIPLTLLWLLLFGPVRSRGWKEGLGPLIRAAVFFSIPVGLALAALLWTNAIKFDSPLETGYGQWGQEKKPLFSGNFFGGLYDLLINVQGSIFIYFPLLTFALFAYVPFFRKHRRDLLLPVVGGVVLLLLYAKMRNSLGVWCYGPRYMLPLLPLLSLPFLRVLDAIFRWILSWWAIPSLLVMTATLGYSCYLQLNVNALPFFVYFELQGVFYTMHDPEIDAYFTNRPFGMINADLLAAKNGQPMPLLDLVDLKLNGVDYLRARQIVRNLTYSNYYWFP